MQADIVVLKRSSGEYEAVCFSNDGALWKARFENQDVMIRSLTRLPDVWEIELADLKKFANRELYPEHVAGVVNAALVSDRELLYAGFVKFVPA